MSEPSHPGFEHGKAELPQSKLKRPKFNNPSPMREAIEHTLTQQKDEAISAGSD